MRRTTCMVQLLSAWWVVALQLDAIVRSFAWAVPASLAGTAMRVRVQATDCAGSMAADASHSSFTVAPPTPLVASVLPALLAPNLPATLALEGSDFAPGAVVTLGGMALATTHANSSRLTAALPAGVLTAPGIVSVTVSNPGGGSAAASVRVGAPGDVMGDGKPDEHGHFAPRKWSMAARAQNVTWRQFLRPSRYASENPRKEEALRLQGNWDWRFEIRNSLNQGFVREAESV